MTCCPAGRFGDLRGPFLCALVLSAFLVCRVSG